MVATQLHYDIEYPNVFTQGQLKAEDIGVTVNKKIKRIGCSTALLGIVERRAASLPILETLVKFR